MKSSKLLTDATTDIKIERGLKILQFAGQYNLRKVYYRNCPMNMLEDAEEGASSKVKTGLLQQHQSNADLLIELNEEIASWGKEVPLKKSPKKQEKPIKSNKLMLEPEPNDDGQSSRSIHASSKVNSESVAQEGSLDSLSNYESQATKRKLKSISEDPLQLVQMSKLQIPPTGIHISQSNIIRVEDRNNVSVHSNHSAISAHSAHSKKSNRQKVEQVGRQSIKQSPKIIVNKIPEVDVSRPPLHDHTHQSSPDKREDFKQNGSQLAGSEKYSFLDKSISRIVSNTSQLRSRQQVNHSNLTDFSLMRQLSASFQDEQNMKMLLKLQNCELEEGYLQRRIINRLQKGYKQVSTIKEITWQSLKMPKMSYGFTRPNYAHVIE